MKTEHIQQAQLNGRQRLEVLPGDIITDVASESAARLGIALVEGPIEKPPVNRTGGATALRRALYRRSPKWVAPARKTAPRARRLEKLAVIGAGGVGSNIAHLASLNDMAKSIALIDIVPGLAESTALDLSHAGGISRAPVRIGGSTDLASVADAEVVVMTAGRPRTPGMSRSDLIEINRQVIRSAAEAIQSHAPNAIVIVVTNPLDEMTAEMLLATGFPRERVIGMAGTLDSSRFRNALAKAAEVDPSDVEAITLGSHGDEMTPIVSHARIKGRPLDVFLSQETVAGCTRDAITGGGQVVSLRQTGSATIAPAHATLELIDHIRGARTGPVPASVMLHGEFGIEDVVLGVPCQLGMSGLIDVDEIRLSPEELQSLRQAAESIRQRMSG